MARVLASTVEPKEEPSVAGLSWFVPKIVLLATPSVIGYEQP